MNAMVFTKSPDIQAWRSLRSSKHRTRSVSNNWSNVMDASSRIKRIISALMASSSPELNPMAPILDGFHWFIVIGPALKEALIDWSMNECEHAWMEG